jgi:phosphate transport system substrate-binding protein
MNRSGAVLMMLFPFALFAADYTVRPAHARPAVEEAHVKIDSKLPVYHAAGALSGTLKGIQSDTTPGITKLWIEDFKKLYPNVSIQCDIAGSGAAGPVLTNDSADFGFIAREMMIKEETPFRQKFGYEPLAIAVSGGSYRTLAFTDALAFFVNKDNPLDKLTFAQIDAIYSKTRKRGAPEDITKWGQLGLKGEWADKPIHLVGVKIENGFEHFLQQRVLDYGEWKDNIEVRDTVIPLADIVAADKYAIGYAGFAYLKPGVKTLAIAREAKGPYYKGTLEEVASQKYPLSRYIFIYVNKRPGKPLDPKLVEFVKFALSREGQQDVVKDGIFLPLPAEDAKRQLAKLK